MLLSYCDRTFGNFWDWELPLDWFMSCQHKTLQLCVSLCVWECVFGHMCKCFLYITTVNMFLAQLNLSKQHTPSWAVKRADRDNWDKKKKKQPDKSFCLRKKNSPQCSEKSKERGSEGRRESRWGERDREMKVTVCGQQCAEFQLLLKPALLLNDWVNRREESLFSIKTERLMDEQKKKRLRPNDR